MLCLMTSIVILATEEHLTVIDNWLPVMGARQTCKVRKSQMGRLVHAAKVTDLCFVATFETHRNKDSRKHNGQKQCGRVTAIVLVGKNDACRLNECTAKSRLFTCVLRKFTPQS